MNANERLTYLLDRYVNGIITVDEQNELFELIGSGRFDPDLEAHIALSLSNTSALDQADLPPHISEEIVRQIMLAEKSTAALIPLEPRRRTSWKKWAIAASVATLISVGWLLLKPEHEQDEFLAQVADKQSSLSNLSDTVQMVRLADGSRIELQPGAKLYHPLHFSDTLRAVFLDGDAFFDIAPDPHQPFVVYGRHIMTRVLGTSFRIQTNPETGAEEVEVRTGRVQVSENNRVNKTSGAVSPVIVTPNQKAIFEPERRQLLTTLVAHPQPVALEPHRSKMLTIVRSFRYDQQILSEILDDLEAVYAVEIITENPALDNCVFTGDISDDNLFTQLKILCLATRSSYEVNGTRILIRGQGCE